MKSMNIIQRTFDFGTIRSRENFFSFALKCVLYIIPAVILGNYTDITIQNSKKDNDFGDYILYYILLQTLIIISTLYLILRLISSYASEFQVSISGGLFLIFYFSIQSNYIDMLQEYLIYSY